MAIALPISNLRPYPGILSRTQGYAAQAWATLATFLACSLMPGMAYAALQLNSATLSVAAPAQGPASVIYVQGGGTFTAAVNGSTLGSTNWAATSSQIGANPVVCNNHANFNANNSTTTINLTLTAPAAAGTYSLSFVAFSNNTCTTSPSNTLTLASSIIVDNTAPTTSAIVIAGTSPTSASSVSWTVTFSESVLGVSAGNFSLVQGGGLSGAAITSVSGSGTTWTVTASTGTGGGTLGLDLSNATGITDRAGNALTGTPVTGGVYTVSVVAGGCTSSTIGADTVVTCTSNGNVTIPSGVTSVRYLVVAGGGGGGGDTGGWASGGGGAGGVLNGTGFAVSAGTYAVSVGAGGSGGTGGASLGGNGGNSTFATLTAIGGGGGASQGISNNGASGGSGGGGRGNGTGGAGTAGQGNAGGNGGGGGNRSAGGGGGAGVAGTTPVNSNGGNGGDGISDNITGAATYYGGGGGGGARNNGFTGGTGGLGGGASAPASGNGVNGTANTGGGGSGTAGGGATTTGGNGGSGIVIIRYTTAGAPDHLEIQGTGTGLTCAATTLTIRACADTACTTLYSGGVSGTFSATGAPTVIWDGTTGGAAGSGFSIPAGSSSITKDVQVATAGSVVFGIAGATPIPTNIGSCNFGSPACTFIASTAGFIFSDTSTLGNAYTIPAQVSGIASPVLYLRAVQAATSNPAICTPAIAGQTVSVNMGYSCNDPASCQPGNLATINTTAIAPAGTTLNLSFDANGSTPVTVRYDDAGKITLNASATVTPFSGATATTLTGSSNAFVVAPHHFGFSGITAAPIKAGNNFSATVTAYNGLATPTATANFGKESAPESVMLSFTRCQPAGGSAGTFSGSVGAFSNGAATANNLNWNEVGNGDISATLASGSYLGSGLTTTGNTGTGGTVCNSAGNVGRFIPDHFDTNVVLAAGVPMPCPSGLTCPILYGGFIYSGQPLTEKIYARSAGGSTTQNYDGTLGFAKSVVLSAWDAPGSTTTANPGNGTLNNSAALATDFISGIATLTTPSYTFNSMPTAPTNIYLRADEAPGGDNVSSNRGAASVEYGVMVVSGRIKLSNALGSELLPLPIKARAQYWNGSTYVASSTDSASTVGNLSFTNCQPLSTASTWPASCPPPTSAAPASVVLVNGAAKLTLSAPGAGNSGSVNMTATTPGYLPSTTASATFGVYKGNSTFIYLREAY